MSFHYAFVDPQFGTDGLESYNKIITSDTPDSCFAYWTEALAKNPCDAVWWDVWKIHDKPVTTPEKPYPHKIESVQYPDDFRRTLEIAWEISKQRKRA